jgi:succinate-acetate transporter protein
MGEFSNWQADRIAAFFGGIAQVLAAKAKVEKAEVK